MASISTDKNGNRRILFADPDGNRKAVYVGKLSKRATQTICFRTEQLLEAKITGAAMYADCASWLSETDDVLYEKLVRVGLVSPREPKDQTELGPFLDEYLESRNDLKRSTKVVRGQVVNDLKIYFGASREVETIQHGEADDFRQWLIGTRKLAPTTINKRIQVARSFFLAMKRKKLIDENPFDGVKAPAAGIKARQRFVTREEIEHVLKSCPDHNWRAIVALARFGGLRCPSEVLSLRWQDINWETGRVFVTSPKTEHHPDDASRIIPLFPELRHHLDESLQFAEKGDIYVIDARYRKSAQGINGWLNSNLRTSFHRIIHKAGLKPWPRVFHNLRASLETELIEQFPIQTVTGWLGNSPRVALKHYAMITDTHFDAAVSGSKQQTTRNPTQTTRANDRQDLPAVPQKRKNPEKHCISQGLAKSKMAGAGFEPTTSRL
jgi:integrase